MVVGNSSIKTAKKCNGFSDDGILSDPKLGLFGYFPIIPNFGSLRHFFFYSLKIAAGGWLSVCAPKPEGYKVAEIKTLDEIF